MARNVNDINVKGRPYKNSFVPHIEIGFFKVFLE